jgi:hypothetical protein
MRDYAIKKISPTPLFQRGVIQKNLPNFERLNQNHCEFQIVRLETELIIQNQRSKGNRLLDPERFNHAQKILFVQAERFGRGHAVAV